MTAWHIAWNDLSQRKVRSLLVMLGLAVGIALLVAVTAALDALETEVATQFKDYGPNLIIEGGSQHTFSYGGIRLEGVLVGAGEELTGDSVALLSTLPEGTMIEGAVPKILGPLTVTGQPILISGSPLAEEFAMKPWLRAVDYLKRYEALKSQESSAGGMGGAALELERQDPALLALGPGEVILGAEAAYQLALFPTMRFPLGEEEYTVKAVLERNGTREDDYLMMDLADAQRILERPGSIDQIELVLDPDKGDEDRLIAAIGEVIPHARISGQTKAMADGRQVLSGLMLFGLVISFFVLLAAVLSSSLALTSTVTERTREIGLFRAVGLRSSFIRRVILLEGMLLSLSGGLIGWLGGLLTARLVMPLLSDTVRTVPWQPELMAMTLGLALLLGAAASLYPAHRASRLDPAEALRFLS